MASSRHALTEAPQRSTKPHWGRPVKSGPRPCLFSVGFPCQGPRSGLPPPISYAMPCVPSHADVGMATDCCTPRGRSSAMAAAAAASSKPPGLGHPRSLPRSCGCARSRRSIEQRGLSGRDPDDQPAAPAMFAVPGSRDRGPNHDPSFRPVRRGCVQANSEPGASSSAARAATRPASTATSS